MISKSVLIGWALIATTSANATDWRYCLTAAADEHKVYMSEPFQTDASMDTVTEAFSHLLARLNLRHGEVQCPRGDTERSISTMRDYAISFNRLNGNEIAKVGGRP
jgi:hypothetical protein